MLIKDALGPHSLVAQQCVGPPLTYTFVVGKRVGVTVAMCSVSPSSHLLEIRL